MLRGIVLATKEWLAPGLTITRASPSKVTYKSAPLSDEQKQKQTYYEKPEPLKGGGTITRKKKNSPAAEVDDLSKYVLDEKLKEKIATQQPTDSSDMVVRKRVVVGYEAGTLPGTKVPITVLRKQQLYASYSPMTDKAGNIIYTEEGTPLPDYSKPMRDSQGRPTFITESAAPAFETIQEQKNLKRRMTEEINRQKQEKKFKSQAGALAIEATAPLLIKAKVTQAQAIGEFKDTGITPYSYQRATGVITRSPFSVSGYVASKIRNTSKQSPQEREAGFQYKMGEAQTKIQSGITQQVAFKQELSQKQDELAYNMGQKIATKQKGGLYEELTISKPKSTETPMYVLNSKTNFNLLPKYEGVLVSEATARKLKLGTLLGTTIKEDGKEKTVALYSIKRKGYSMQTTVDRYVAMQTTVDRYVANKSLASTMGFEMPPTIWDTVWKGAKVGGTAGLIVAGEVFKTRIGINKMTKEPLLNAWKWYGKTGVAKQIAESTTATYGSYQPVQEWLAKNVVKPVGEGFYNVPATAVAIYTGSKTPFKSWTTKEEDKGWFRKTAEMASGTLTVGAVLLPGAILKGMYVVGTIPVAEPSDVKKEMVRAYYDPGFRKTPLTSALYLTEGKPGEFLSSFTSPESVTSLIGAGIGAYGYTMNYYYNPVTGKRSANPFPTGGKQKTQFFTEKGKPIYYNPDAKGGISGRLVQTKSGEIFDLGQTQTIKYTTKEVAGVGKLTQSVNKVFGKQGYGTSAKGYDSANLVIQEIPTITYAKSYGRDLATGKVWTVDTNLVTNAQQWKIGSPWKGDVWKTTKYDINPAKGTVSFQTDLLSIKANKLLWSSKPKTIPLQEYPIAYAVSEPYLQKRGEAIREITGSELIGQGENPPISVGGTATQRLTQFLSGKKERYDYVTKTNQITGTKNILSVSTEYKLNLKQSAATTASDVTKLFSRIETIKKPTGGVGVYKSGYTLGTEKVSLEFGETFQPVVDVRASLLTPRKTLPSGDVSMRSLNTVIKGARTATYMRVTPELTAVTTYSTFKSPADLSFSFGNPLTIYSTTPTTGLFASGVPSLGVNIKPQIYGVLSKVGKEAITFGDFLDYSAKSVVKSTGNMLKDKRGGTGAGVYKRNEFDFTGRELDSQGTTSIETSVPVTRYESVFKATVPNLKLMTTSGKGYAGISVNPLIPAITGYGSPALLTGLVIGGALGGAFEKAEESSMFNEKAVSVSNMGSSLFSAKVNSMPEVLSFGESSLFTKGISLGQSQTSAQSWVLVGTGAMAAASSAASTITPKPTTPNPFPRGRTPTVPPVTPPPVIPPIVTDLSFPYLKFKQGRGKGWLPKEGRGATKYSPSLIAVALNIRGKAPTGKLTGLEMRPISTSGFRIKGMSKKKPKSKSKTKRKKHGKR